MLPVVVGAPLVGALYAQTGRFTEAFAFTAALPLAALLACLRLPTRGPGAGPSARGAG